jgi:hypothetical protein
VTLFFLLNSSPDAIFSLRVTRVTRVTPKNALSDFDQKNAKN